MGSVVKGSKNYRTLKKIRRIDFSKSWFFSGKLEDSLGA
jgi:hypothetical protein